MNILKIFTLIENEDGTTTSLPFPNAEEQAVFDDYEYTAARMGGAPSITAEIKHRLCLDNLWTEKQYVEFQGCKYFVRDTPSSSKNNTDNRYEHDITFLHERFVLENVYMIDAVFNDPEHPEAQPETDKYVSNSTKVVFWGDIREFVGRFNACLYSAGLGGTKESGGYYVVVDDDVTSKELLVSFEDKFFSEALQEIFNTFKLPYYWEGKCCHIGFSSEHLSEVFEYGNVNALLSIEKQNTNQGYCNRATGVGSTDNIPYYYPRTTSPEYTIPHAVEGNKGITDDNQIQIEVGGRSKFDMLEAGLPTGSPWEGLGIQFSGYESSAKLTCERVSMWSPYEAFRLGEATDVWSGSSGFAPAVLSYASYLLTGELKFDPRQWLTLPTDGMIALDGWGGFLDGDFSLWKDIYNGINTRNLTAAQYAMRTFTSLGDYTINANALLESSPKEYSIKLNLRVDKSGNYCLLKLPIGIYWDGVAQEIDLTTVSVYYSNIDGSEKTAAKIRNVVSLDPEYDELGRRVFQYILFDIDYWTSKGDFSVIISFLPRKYHCWLPLNYKPHNYYKNIQDNYNDPRAIYNFDDIPLGTVVDAGAASTILCGDGTKRQVLPAWAWNMENRKRRNHINVATPVITGIPSCWHKTGAIQVTDLYRKLSDFGLSSTQTPKDGDRIIRMYVLDEIDNIPTQTMLMPTIYRNTKGKEPFYNALNKDALLNDEKYVRYSNFYKDEKGEYYEFEHEFIQENPRETKYNFPDIKPTIEGIVGVHGAIDEIIEVAFDDNDHDYLKGESLYKTAEDYVDELSTDSEYDHPYFFVKIRQTAVEDNPALGFNLFDSVTENEMTLSLRGGDCGGCTFRIMVTKEGKKNPVITDGKGNLLKDQYGRVRLVGANNQGGYGIDETQQNTKTGDVWLCLEKETSTYGILMPNVASDFRPTAGTKFVFLNINLPILYITEAEARLSKAIVEQMWKDNSERFSFNINFSRIYFKENPTVLPVLNENSKIFVRYNGLTIPLYVNSYTFKMSSGNPLPEISVDLKDEIAIGTVYRQNDQTDIKLPISAISGGDGGASVPIVTSEDKIFTPSDGSVYSTLRSNMEFLFKTKEEYMEYILHFMAGIDVKNVLNGEVGAFSERLTVGDYVRGITGALKGLQFSADGSIHARSLFLEESLAVPSVDFNKAMVLNGVFIIAPACGEIENVEYEQDTINGNKAYIQVDEEGSPLFYKDGVRCNAWEGEPVVSDIVTGYPKYKTKGVATLKLERGEYGSVKEGDMLLGFWHDEQLGAQSDFDGKWNENEQCFDRNGNIGLAGFASVYMLVTKTYQGDDKEADVFNKHFEYELRYASDKDWHLEAHPYAGMKFYSFGNVSDKSRQSIYVITRDYSVRLVNKDKWTYNEDNVIEIHGLLDGFQMKAEGKDGKPYVKRFHGYGNVEGNSYIFGTIDQFDRVSLLEDQKTMYLTNNSETAPSKDEEGWSETPTSVSEDAKYMWQYNIKMFSDDKTEESSVYLAAMYSTGKDGVDGLIIRRSEWEIGKEYRNDSNRLQKADDGNYYLDEIIVSSYNGGNGKKFVCKQTHTSKVEDKLVTEESMDGDLWTPVGELKPFATPYADITAAFIEFLQSKKLTLVDENGKVYGAFGGVSGEGEDIYPLWVGAETGETAPFSVRKDGSLKLKGHLRVGTIATKICSIVETVAKDGTPMRICSLDGNFIPLRTTTDEWEKSLNYQIQCNINNNYQEVTLRGTNGVRHRVVFGSNEGTQKFLAQTAISGGTTSLALIKALYVEDFSSLTIALSLYDGIFIKSFNGTIYCIDTSNMYYKMTPYGAEQIGAVAPQRPQT